MKCKTAIRQLRQITKYARDCQGNAETGPIDDNGIIASKAMNRYDVYAIEAGIEALRDYLNRYGDEDINGSKDGNN